MQPQRVEAHRPACLVEAGVLDVLEIRRELRTHRDAFLAYVYVNPHALICARILSRDAAQPIDRALLVRQVRRPR